MDIKLADLLEGKGTIIKDKQYLPTRAYVEPFINRLCSIPGIDFKCRAELPKQVTLNTDSQDLTYNRVWIEGILPDEYTVDNHERVIGMVYGLDTRVPICKFYLSSINSACTNMMVFNPSLLKVQVIEGNIDYALLDAVISAEDHVHQYIECLNNTSFVNNIEAQEKVLGKWCRNTIIYNYTNGINKASISSSTAVKAYKSIFINDKSDYYNGKSSEISMFDIYNAWTYIISNEDSDIMNKFEKTYLISKIMELNINE